MASPHGIRLLARGEYHPCYPTGRAAHQKRDREFNHAPNASRAEMVMNNNQGHDAINVPKDANRSTVSVHYLIIAELRAKGLPQYR
ncbi:hypothetical protein SDC9_204983 [bioreactor metagenome]|uniref:Uncharacterized protein n=1 Tax=bioreactor metagenome TaxID=1076179 RepID=A0A645J3K8_9ZZZZ